MAAITVHAPIFHPLGRLDRDPARVEAHALADDREVAVEGVLLPFPAGPHHDHPGRVVAALADGEEHTHPELAGTVGLDHVDPQVVPRGDVASLLGEDLGGDVVGRPVRQRASVVRALADDHAAFGCLLG